MSLADILSLHTAYCKKDICFIYNWGFNEAAKLGSFLLPITFLAMDQSKLGLSQYLENIVSTLWFSPIWHSVSSSSFEPNFYEG